MSRTRRARAIALLAVLVAPVAALGPAAADDTLDLGGAASAADVADRDRADRDRADRRAARADREKSRRGLEPGTTRHAEVVKAGWWWVANEPPPETGLVAAPQPPTPTTPKGAVPVGSVGGDAEKITAVELRLDAESGSTVQKLAMVLRESAEPGATENAEAATILACPVDELFWADGSAAAWKDRPAYDCESGVPGKRSADGLWSFDLTGLAATWLAEGNTDSRSVVLVEDVEAPESFQVTFDGPRLDGIGLALVAEPPPPDGDPGPGATTSGSGGGGTVSGSGGGGVSSGGTAIGGGSPATAPGSAAPVGGGDAAPVAADTGATEQAALQPVAAPAWYSGLPKASFVLAPLLLALAYLMMLALGPDARPVPVTGRHGVSRALDRLREAGLRLGRDR